MWVLKNETSLKTKIALTLKEQNHTVANSYDFDDLEKYFHSKLNITEKLDNEKLAIKKVILLLQDNKVWFFWSINFRKNF
jgi:hypothetical protein